MSEDKPPTFFIPGCTPEEQEKVYAAMATSCNVHVPGAGQRLYAISHHHDGDVWFATVGKTLTGRRPVWKGRKKTEESRPIEDLALVRVISPATVCVGSSLTAGPLLEGVPKGESFHGR